MPTPPPLRPDGRNTVSSAASGHKPRTPWGTRGGALPLPARFLAGALPGLVLFSTTTTTTTTTTAAAKANAATPRAVAVSSVERMSHRVSPRLYSVSGSARGLPAAPAAPLVLELALGSERISGAAKAPLPAKPCAAAAKTRSATHEAKMRPRMLLAVVVRSVIDVDPMRARVCRRTSNREMEKTRRRPRPRKRRFDVRGNRGEQSAAHSRGAAGGLRGGGTRQSREAGVGGRVPEGADGSEEGGWLPLVVCALPRQ